MASIEHRHILVGIETDPTRYHGESAQRPALLNRVAAEQVLSHVSADLTALFPSVNRCSLSMAGALFDQTQVIRPGLPVFKGLETLQQSSNPGEEFLPRLLSIGASEGRMPLESLQPFADIPLGILQILPILVTGPKNLVEELSTEMEHVFFEKGQLSAHSAKGIESQFRVSVNHARFMTITDLNALLHLQLKHFGALALWELLDAALNQSLEPLEVRTDKGLTFKWYDGAVHAFFESFDWWSNHGNGVQLNADNRQLQSAYADRTLEYRRYLTTLAAHGVNVIQHLPGLEDAVLDDSFLMEESTLNPQKTAVPVTEHSTDETGIIAVTVVKGKRQINFYPLNPGGLNDLHQFIREQGLGGDIAYPGHICYDEHSRQLVSDDLPDLPGNL